MHLFPNFQGISPLVTKMKIKGIRVQNSLILETTAVCPCFPPMIKKNYHAHSEMQIAYHSDRH